MDIVSILLSVNKIALLAFFVTVCIIIVEIYHLTSHKPKNEKPIIPDFNAKKKYHRTEVVKTVKIKPQKIAVSVKPNNMIILIIAVLILIVLGGYMVTYSINQKQLAKPANNNLHKLEITSSDGIHIYDANWNELKPPKFNGVTNGAKVYIGIETEPGVFIDKARIRVNTSVWDKHDETNLYKSLNKIFYREYIVATNTAQLRVEAQLHSPKNGWLE